MCIACERLMSGKWLHSPAPAEPGVQTLSADLADLVPFIDWKYFLYAWGFPLNLAVLDEDSEKGEEARRLMEDGKKFLQEAVERKYFEARAVIGIFPVVRNGDDVTVVGASGEAPASATETIHFLRQQNPTEESPVCRSLADFLTPKGPDWLGMFAASVGFGVDEFAVQCKKDGDAYRAMLAETISGRLTEAYSEKLHRDVIHKHWGYAPHREFGIRPAIGYPSAPDHTEKAAPWRLLDVENRIGMKLTESYMMWPMNSVCGYYFAHPRSVYFSVGKLGEDQLEDYARRKNWDLETAKKWLGR